MLSDFFKEKKKQREKNLDILIKKKKEISLAKNHTMISGHYCHTKEIKIHSIKC